MLFPCPLAYLATFASRAQADSQKETVDMWAACLHAGTKQHMKGITASTNDTVVTSRNSTVYYQTKPRKSDGVSESVQCVPTRMPLATTNHECVHPSWLANAANVGLHPICNGERVSSTNNGLVKWFRDNHTAHCQTHEIPWAPTQSSIQTQQSLTMPTTTQ